MKKVLLVFLIVICSSPTLSQEILDRLYYFVNGEELTALKQEEDMIYVSKCNVDFECDEEYRRSYKIWRAKQEGNRVLLEVERMDPVPGVDNPYPPERFRFMGFIKEDNNHIRFINEAISVTKQEINDIPFEMAYLNEKFGFTYYSEPYLMSLNTEYELTKDEAEGLLADLKQNEGALEYYNQTKTGDIYRIAISAELLSLELIRRGLCPIKGKNRLEDALLEEKTADEEVEQEKNGDSGNQQMNKVEHDRS